MQNKGKLTHLGKTLVIASSEQITDTDHLSPMCDVETNKMRKGEDVPYSIFEKNYMSPSFQGTCTFKKGLQCIA